MTKSDNGSELVFVYGTLRRGGSNAFRMEGAEFVGEGFVRGSLYAISWYPGLVLDDNAGKVRGEVFRVRAELLRALDEFEGREYRRVKSDVIVNEIQQRSVWVYEWIAPVDPRKKIISGDWTTYESGARIPLFTILTTLPLFGFGACLGIRMEPIAELLQQGGIRTVTIVFLIVAPVLGLVCAWIGEQRREEMRWLRLLFSAFSCFLLFVVIAFLVQPL